MASSSSTPILPRPALRGLDQSGNGQKALAAKEFEIFERLSG
jgi:hypothetical protein